MAKYYINQKYSTRDRFKILDEKQQEAFFAQGKFSSFGKEIKLYAVDGQEILLIREK